MYCQKQKYPTLCALIIFGTYSAVIASHRSCTFVAKQSPCPWEGGCFGQKQESPRNDGGWVVTIFAKKMGKNSLKTPMW